MAATLKTRKPVNELTVEDLQAFPIWEFATDEEGVEGQDETWVRPVRRNQVPMEAYSQLVAADFSTADGVRLQGFMTVTTADGIEITPGAVLGEGFYRVLPGMSEERAREEGLSWAIQSRKEIVEALGGSPASVFPMAYELRIAIRGEKALRSGVVE
ncbi:MAG TPA: hypothetical protein VN673_01085 [Clostridia bacterium]|nr:hypothetical protein [Clostridia bacterium]